MNKHLLGSHWGCRKPSWGCLKRLLWPLPWGILIVRVYCVWLWVNITIDSSLWLFWLNNRDNKYNCYRKWISNQYMKSKSKFSNSQLPMWREKKNDRSYVSLCTWRRGVLTIHACPHLYVHKKTVFIFLSHHSHQDLISLGRHLGPII